MHEPKVDDLEFTIAEKIENLVMKGIRGELIYEDEETKLDVNGVVRGACEGLAVKILELVSNPPTESDHPTQQQPRINSDKTLPWCPICACGHLTGQHLFGTFEK